MLTVNFVTDRVIEIINDIYDTGEILEDTCKYIFRVLLKKPGANELELFRTNSLMGYMYNIYVI